MRQAWEITWRHEVTGELFPMFVAADEVSVWRMMYPQYTPKEDDVLAEFRRIGAEDGLAARSIRIVDEDEWEGDQSTLRSIERLCRQADEFDAVHDPECVLPRLADRVYQILADLYGRLQQAEQAAGALQVELNQVKADLRDTEHEMRTMRTYSGV